MMMMTMTMMMMMMLPNFSLRRQSSKRRGVSHSYQDKKVRKKKIQKNQKICEIFFFEIFRKNKQKRATHKVVTKSILSLFLSLSLCIVKETKEF